MSCGNTDICWNCSAPSASSNTSIADKLIREYLTEITCIPWYRDFEKAAQNKGMFGVLEALQTASRGTLKQKAKEIDAGTCVIYRQNRLRSYNLRIQGIKYREYNDEQIEVMPSDVLEEIEARHMQIKSVRDILSEAEMSITSFGDVLPLVDEATGCCYYDRAEMNIQICTVKEVSIKTDKQAIENLCFRVCGGEINCPDPEDCKHANNL